jgi:hypothetical protein
MIMGRKIDSVISALERKQRVSEYRTFKYKGAKLSHADASTIIFYLERYAANGSFYGLMDPTGGVKIVLDQVV